MMDIAIYGAGGFGRETAFMIRQINERRLTWNLIGFFDDSKPKGTLVDGLPVLGNIDDARSLLGQMKLTIAIADPRIRKQVIQNLNATPDHFPTLVHPTAQLGDAERNQIGHGCIITANTIITTNVQIGDFTIINLLCTIGHDVILGDYCSIMPGCSLSGFIQIGECAFIGSGARLLPGITIGSNSKVGAGAVVLDSVGEGRTVVGVPAKEVSYVG